MAQDLTREDFDIVVFPNGELKLILLKTITRTIMWKYNGKFSNHDGKLSPSEELVILMQLDMICIKFVKHINLITDYLPFKRQDKDKLLGEIKFNEIFQKHLNIFHNISFEEYMPHDFSTKKTCWRKNATLNFIHTGLSKIREHGYDPKIDKPVSIIIPDAGAQKRFDMELLKFMGFTTFEKERDAKTGALKFKKFKGKCNKYAIIIDDIISYGGTFKHIAGELREKGAEHIVLVINHSDGVYDKQDMKKYIDEVIVVNGMM